MKNPPACGGGFGLFLGMVVGGGLSRGLGDVLIGQGPVLLDLSDAGLVLLNVDLGGGDPLAEGGLARPPAPARSA